MLDPAAGVRGSAEAAPAQPARSSARQRESPPSATRRSAVRRPFARRVFAAVVRTAREARTPGSSPSAVAFTSRDFFRVSTSRSSAGSDSVRSPRRTGGQSDGARAAALARASRRACAKASGSGRGPGKSFERSLSPAAAGFAARRRRSFVRTRNGGRSRARARASRASQRARAKARSLSVRAFVPLIRQSALGIRLAPGRKNGSGQARALLGVPREASFRLEVPRDRFHERREVEDVGRRVGDERRRERPLAPVGALVRLVERDPDARREERRETDLLLAEKLRREHRVEERRRPKAVAAKEEPEVVVGAVHEEPPGREPREEGADVERLRAGPRGAPCRPTRAAGDTPFRSSDETSPPRCRARRRRRGSRRARRGARRTTPASETRRTPAGEREESVTAPRVHRRERRDPQRAPPKGFPLTPARFAPDTRGGNKWSTVASCGYPG